MQKSLPAALLIIGCIAAACSKNAVENSSQPTNNAQNNTSAAGGSRNLSVFLTDAPGRFDAVYIDIASVEVKIDTSIHQNDDHYGDGDKDEDNDSKRPGTLAQDRDQYGKWVALNFNPGLYDVLALRNGLDTLLAKGTINGTARKIRFTLGEKSYLVKDSIEYPLTIVSARKNNYLYVNLHQESRQEDSTKVGVWIDFDLGRSIIYRGNHFFLLPVLKPFCDRNAAQIEGAVKPAAAGALIKVYNATDTATAFPNRDGYFKIRGLKTGSYSVLYDASNGYKDTLVNNISVTKGKTTSLPEITLVK
ncbi:DUF4382 domain-containing protein [Niabella sp. CC-SYL272]|uniref:DUF4382 domain-containing protein n=1 Tax=Niabella agricola TaxID=2891571 RepID=UPI001F258AFA|nr:DUF4382 domain-containing protein [Niabella agricola]MCF3111237.1 DUF4382 domain-containing protein [Niabella agricola]